MCGLKRKRDPANLRLFKRLTDFVVDRFLFMFKKTYRFKTTCNDDTVIGSRKQQKLACRI